MSRETISVAAGAAAVGLLAGVLLGSSWTRRAEVAGLGGTGTGTGTGMGTGTGTGTGAATGPDTADERVLEARIGALEAKFERSLAALEAAKNELVATREGRAASSPGGAGTAAASALAPATAPATVTKPGERAPGALVPWLPPEGVPLVRAWYVRWLGEKLAASEAESRSARDERDRSMVEFLARGLKPALESLSKVVDEMSLARWLHEHKSAAGTPEPWQLAEFAKTWDGK